MPAPTALDNARTSTPDNSLGIQIATVVAQEGTLEIPAGVMLSTRIAANITADRSGVTTADSTADMTTSGFGSTGRVNINNCGAVAVWCKFSGASGATGSATIEVVFWDAHSTPVPMFISQQLTFAALTQTSAASTYMTRVQLIDTYGASSCRAYIKVLSATTTIDVFTHPV